MTLQDLQAFIGRSMVSSGALTALAAVLDAKATGTPLEPRLAARADEMLEAVGALELVATIAPAEASTMCAFIRAMYLLDAKMLFAATRSGMWNHAEPEILASIGEFARVHAHTVTREIVPACPGLHERFSKKGASLLDVGVGVAGTAIALAQMWPELAIVGIDPWQPSLRIARENVDSAGLADRIELREESVASLSDSAAYDYVYFANNFIPEPTARAGLVRALAALRPGGYISIGATNDAAPPPVAALFRLRETQWGGPAWSPPQAEGALRDAGFTDVRTVPPAPGAVVTWIVGRKPG